MNELLDPLATARRPTQQRAIERFNAILEEAEKLLEEAGLSGFSIPVLAERLSYTRGSVYAYFPTPYAILNELVSRYLERLQDVFYRRADELRRMSWREAVTEVIDHAVAFQNSHPAARLLLLGGAVTDHGYRAQELTIKHLGDLGREIWEQHGTSLPRDPDITTLSADIATACFRRSFFEHGTITPAYRDAARTAMIGFLESYARANSNRPEGKAARKRARRTARSA